MDFPDEASFNAAFQKRLKETRESLGWSQPKMAAFLAVKIDAYKKYESRVGSVFPLYLLPKLAMITDQPVSYWLGLREQPSTRPHLRQVR